MAVERWQAEEPGVGADARQRAFDRALANGLKTVVGIEIHSELKVLNREVERNGKVDQFSDVESTLQTRLGVVKVRGVHAQYCQIDGRVRAQVSLPAEELARLKRQSDGRTLAVLTCGRGAEQVCGGLDRERVRAIAQAAGHHVSDVLLRQDLPDASLLGQLARSAGASKLLHVALTAQSSGVQQGLRICHALAVATLWDAEAVKQVAQATPLPPVNPEGFKGVVYADMGTPTDACRQALMNAWKELEALSTTLQIETAEGSTSP